MDMPFSRIVHESRCKCSRIYLVNIKEFFSINIFYILGVFLKHRQIQGLPPAGGEKKIEQNLIYVEKFVSAVTKI